jgi:cysteine sulfinate desulfinase/cysteine desulfurase-like protein
LEPCSFLERSCAEVRRLPVDRHVLVDPVHVQKAIRPGSPHIDHARQQ